MFNDWQESFTSGSGVQIADFYWNDAVIASPLMATRITNHNEAIKHFEKLAALPKISINIKDYRIQLFEGAALISGEYTLGYEIDGLATSAPMRFTMVVMRRSDFWKILEDHTSAVPVEPQG